MTDPPLYPRTTLFLVFKPKKGKKRKNEERHEILLVRKTERDPWTVPLAIVAEEPSTICLEFLLAQFLKDSSVTGLAPVDPKHWDEAKDVFSRFGFYECSVPESTLAKSGQLAWFTNGQVNMAANIDEDTRAALGLAYVQGRLN